MVEPAKAKWRAFFLVTAIVATASAAASSGAARVEAAAAPAEANGLKLALEVKPARWKPGDRIELTCAATNVSEKPIRIPAWGLDMFEPLEFTDAQGKTLPGPSYGCKHCREYVPEDFPTLAPGETKRFAANASLAVHAARQYLTVWEGRGGAWGYELPNGAYQVSALAENENANERATLPRDEAMLRLWTGNAVSAPVKVTVGVSAAAETPPAGDAVDPTRLEKAEVVVRATCKAVEAGPGRGGWPQWTLTVNKVFKGADDAALKPGAKITLIALDAPDGREATFYLRKDEAYGAGYYRLKDNAARDISHESKKSAAADANGAEAVKGLQIAFEMTPRTWKPGDKIELACTVTNVSDQLIGMPAWGLEADRVIEITDAAGRTLANPQARWTRHRRLTPDDFPNLPARQSRRFVLAGRITEKKELVVGELTGGTWLWPLADGEYSVRAVFNNTHGANWGSDYGREAKPANLWTGEALSKPVKVMVGDAAAPAARNADKRITREEALRLARGAAEADLNKRVGGVAIVLADKPQIAVNPDAWAFTWSGDSKAGAYIVTVRVDASGRASVLQSKVGGKRD